MICDPIEHRSKTANNMSCCQIRRPLSVHAVLSCGADVFHDIGGVVEHVVRTACQSHICAEEISSCTSELSTLLVGVGGVAFTALKWRFQKEWNASSCYTSAT